MTVELFYQLQTDSEKAQLRFRNSNILTTQQQNTVWNFVYTLT